MVSIVILALPFQLFFFNFQEFLSKCVSFNNQESIPSSQIEKLTQVSALQKLMVRNINGAFVRIYPFKKVLCIICWVLLMSVYRTLLNTFTLFFLSRCLTFCLYVYHFFIFSDFG